MEENNHVPQRLLTRCVLAVSFLLSLGFSWSGTYASIDKGRLPDLLFADSRDAQSLIRVMVELRDKLYAGRDSVSHPVIIVANSIYDSRRKEEAPILMTLADRRVRLSPRLISDLRGLFLLHPYSETDVLNALARIRPGTLSFNPHLFQYGGFFLYPLGTALFVAAHFDILALTPRMDLYLLHPEIVSRIFAVGEMFIGLVAALAIFAIYQAALFMERGRSTALWACVFMALTLQMSIESHVLKPFSYCVPWMLWAFYFVFRSQQAEPRSKEYFWAGFFSGLSIGCLYLTWFLPLVMLAGHHGNPRRRARGWKPLSAALGGLAGGFFLFNPYYLISPAEPAREWLFLMNIVRDTGAVDIGARFFGFFASEIPQAMSWPLALLAYAGIALGLVRRTSTDRILLIGGGAFLIQTLWIHGGAHYAMPLIPLLVLMAARFAAFALSLPAWNALSRAVLASTVAVALLNQLSFALLFRQEDPIYSLGGWVRLHVPSGSRIMLISNNGPSVFPIRYWDYRYNHPPANLPLSGAALAGGASDISSRPADFIIVGEGAGMMREDAPLRVSAGNISYERLVLFERSSLLSGLFPSKQLPPLWSRYLVYGRLRA